MNFEQTAILIGVVGKKGTGTLDNGQAWTTDRVELHVLAPFTESDTMAHGQTAMVYNVENYAEHYDNAKQLIDQPIVLKMTMEPSKKLGQAPRMKCIGFYAEAAPVSKSPAPAPVAQQTALPEGVQVKK